MLEYKKFNYSYNYFIYNKANCPKNYEELINLSKKKYNTIGNLRSYNDAAIGSNPLNLKYFNKIIKLDLKKKL